MKGVALMKTHRGAAATHPTPSDEQATAVRASGNGSLDRHIRRTIFAPLDMAGTDFLRLDISASNVATGYLRAVEFPGQWQSNILQLGRRGDPSGGSYSTAPDMLRFASALQRNQLLRPETTRQMTMGRYPYSKGLYGYGVSEEMANGHRIYGHSGGHYGIADELLIFEDLGITAIILTNCDVDAYFAIANWLKRELVGETASTRAYWQSRAVIETTIAGGQAAGRAAAAQSAELREIVIALAGQKALHRGENAAGMALLLLNRELFPQSSEAVLNLATAYRVTGDIGNARTAYADYLVMEPEDSEARQMLTRMQ